MLSVRAAANNVVIGSWARVKNGTYKKDVCKILAEEPNGKLRVLLVPRPPLAPAGPRTAAAG